jgi:hypothetical protein
VTQVIRYEAVCARCGGLLAKHYGVWAHHWMQTGVCTTLGGWELARRDVDQRPVPVKGTAFELRDGRRIPLDDGI